MVLSFRRMRKEGGAFDGDENGEEPLSSNGGLDCFCSGG